MKKSINNILFLGLGGAGQRHLRIFSKFLPKANLYAWRAKKKTPTLNENFTVSKEKIEKVYNIKMLKSKEEALNCKADLAVIANPSHLHYDTIKECVDHRMNIFVEKPSALNLDDSLNIKKMIKKNNLDFYISFQRHHHPLVKKLFYIIKNNKIGSIMSIKVNVGSFVPHWHKYEDFRDLYACKNSLGGGIIYTECHELDIILTLFGYPNEIFSKTAQIGPYKIEADDSAIIVLDYKKFFATINLCFMQQKEERIIEIFGQKGYVYLDLFNQKIKTKNYNTESESEIDIVLNNEELFELQLHDFLRNFPNNSKTYINRIINLTKLFEAIKNG